ncbi:MAG: Lrp/AsnC family transcriptional regulator [Candidatus Nanohaloarchaea archaeon]
MDEKDSQILEILKEDGRASYTRIAEEISVSEGTVRNRVEKLQEDGVIEKFTVEIGGEKGVSAFVSVSVSTGRGFDEVISEFPEDVEVFEVAGDMDILVKVVRGSSREINDAVDKIREVNGVENTKTYMILSRKRS